MFTTIKGLSEKRRLPRINKIRLGVKAVSNKTGAEYPTETSYFVCPPEVCKVYGEKPTELDVMFPVDDVSVVSPQAYEYYGSSKGLKCVGDGETAMRINDQTGEMVERDCPCDYLTEKKCSKRMHLRVILPKVNMGGIYQIDTSSFNSIVDINSSIDYIRALIGRIALVPLKLKRVKTETHYEGKKQNHFTLKLELNASVDDVNFLRSNNTAILSSASQYSLPSPLDDDQEGEPVVAVVTEEEAEKINKENGEGLPEPRPKTVMPAPMLLKETTTVTNVTKSKNESKYMIYGIESLVYETNTEAHAILAKTAKESNLTVEITYSLLKNGTKKIADIGVKDE